MAAQTSRFLRLCCDETEPLCALSEALEDLAVAYDYLTRRYSSDLAGAVPADR